jgi:hypothetical protein
VLVAVSKKYCGTFTIKNGTHILMVIIDKTRDKIAAKLKERSHGH